MSWQLHTSQKGFTVMTITLILVAVGVVFAATLLLMNESFQKRVGVFTRNASETLSETFSFDFGGSGNSGGPSGGGSNGNSGNNKNAQGSCTVELDKSKYEINENIVVEVEYAGYDKSPTQFEVTCEGGGGEGTIKKCSGQSGTCQDNVMCRYATPSPPSTPYTITATSGSVSCQTTVKIVDDPGTPTPN